MRVRLAVCLALIGLVAAGCATATATTPGAATVGSVTCGGTVSGAAADQMTNAQAIAAVAVRLGLGDPGILVGVLTANVETDLHNANFGDMTGPGGSMSTSRGLFQQLDAWGTLPDRMDPTKSATLFYTGGGQGQKGLMQIPGWQQMDPGVAMQAVQGSQFAGGASPGYAGKLALAKSITAAISPTCKAGPVGGGGGGAAAGPGASLNASQDPTTFGWVHPPTLEPLVWQGHQFGQVAAGTAKLWTAMLNALVPTIPGGLNSNLGCFEDRANVNNPSVLSFHAYGLACDLNTDANPNGANPQSLSGQFVLPMTTSALVRSFGMEWGGDWTSSTPDAMHIEIAQSPQQVAALIASLGG